MNAFQQCLDRQPSSPQGFPAWWTIAFAAQIATRACDGVPTLRSGHTLGIAMIQIGHDLDDVGWQDLTGQLLWVLSGRSPQLHQTHGHGSNQPQPRAQSFIVLHLTLLDPAARFESWME